MASLVWESLYEAAEKMAEAATCRIVGLSHFTSLGFFLAEDCPVCRLKASMDDVLEAETPDPEDHGGAALDLAIDEMKEAR